MLREYQKRSFVASTRFFQQQKLISPALPPDFGAGSYVSILIHSSPVPTLQQAATQSSTFSLLSSQISPGCVVFFSSSQCVLMMICECICIGSTGVENMMIPASVGIGGSRVESISLFQSLLCPTRWLTNCSRVIAMGRLWGHLTYMEMDRNIKEVRTKLSPAVYIITRAKQSLRME